MKDTMKMLKMLHDGGHGSEMDGEHADAYRNVLGHLKHFAKGMMTEDLKKKGMGAEPKAKAIEVTKVTAAPASAAKMDLGDFEDQKEDEDEGMEPGNEHPMDHELGSHGTTDETLNEGHEPPALHVDLEAGPEGHEEDPMHKMRMMMHAKRMGKAHEGME